MFLEYYSQISALPDWPLALQSVEMSWVGVTLFIFSKETPSLRSDSPGLQQQQDKSLNFQSRKRWRQHLTSVTEGKRLGCATLGPVSETQWFHNRKQHLHLCWRKSWYYIYTWTWSFFCNHLASSPSTFRQSRQRQLPLWDIVWLKSIASFHKTSISGFMFAQSAKEQKNPWHALKRSSAPLD